MSRRPPVRLTDVFRPVRLIDVFWGGRVRRSYQAQVRSIALEAAVDSRASFQGNTITRAERTDWKFLDGGVWEKRGWFDAGCGMFVSGVKARQYVLCRLGLSLDRLLAGKTQEIVPFSQLRVELARQKRWTPDELRVLEDVAASRGWAWVEEHAELILDQARAFGELEGEVGRYSLAPCRPPRPSSAPALGRVQSALHRPAHGTTGRMIDASLCPLPGVRMSRPRESARKAAWARWAGKKKGQT